jgi:hypothetical protein
MMRYVSREDEVVGIRWLWVFATVDTDPIEPAEKDESCEGPC